MNFSDESNIPSTIPLPTPTAWPIVTAFGLVLIFAGLVTTLIVSFVGFLCGLTGAIGWFRDVFPHPHHESVPVHPPEERAQIKTPARSVDHLRLGQAGHRVRVPVEVHPYRSGIRGGLAGAVVMALLACAYGLAFQGSIWYPINLLAAAGVPELAQANLETLKQFSMAGLLVGSISHLSISLLIGLLYVVILPMLPTKFQWFWGGIITPLLWTALVYVSLGFVNPALAEYISWPWFIICQVAFGMVAGYVVFKSEKVETMQTWPLAAKMGVEIIEQEEGR